MTYAGRIVRTAIFATALCAFGCHDQLPGKPNPKDRPKTPAEIKDFTVLFRQHCSGCHGAEGKLGPAPPLNDPIFLAIVPDKTLVDVITNGRPGTPMPAFAISLEGTLTESQIKSISTGLKKQWHSDQKPPDGLPQYAAQAGEHSVSIDRGEKLFAKACALCHGDRGEGAGEGESPGRINDPALLALMSDQALRRIIITGRPDLGMPDYAGTEGRESDFKPLSSEEIDDIVGLLAHWRTTSGKLAADD